MNTSQSGGYIQPISSESLPKHLNLQQFIQTVMVGVSGLPGPLVRPEWQRDPPKQPDIDINWMAFGITSVDPDTYAAVTTGADGATQLQRQEGIEVACSVYGPDAMEVASLIRDNLQLSQNLEALRSANMGFTEVSRAIHAPDLINERFIDRVQMTVYLRRQIQRLYPIVSILSASGTVHSVVGNEEYLLAWATQT